MSNGAHSESEAAADDDETLVIVCAGPPWCALENDAAVEAQKAGCVWCTRYRVTATSDHVVSKPGNA